LQAHSITQGNPFRSRLSKLEPPVKPYPFWSRLPTVARKSQRTIRLQTFTHETPKRMFEWISKPDLLERWMPDNASIDPTKGGRYSMGWKGGPTHTGSIVAYDPGKRIALTWEWPGMENRLVTKLELAVKRTGRGSIFLLTHSGFPKDERWVELCGGAIQGWTYFLMNLKSVVDYRKDLRSPFDW
jgi:uncharacterized protein YndB with AHSA1/START domain